MREIQALTYASAVQQNGEIDFCNAEVKRQFFNCKLAFPSCTDAALFLTQSDGTPNLERVRALQSFYVAKSVPEMWTLRGPDRCPLLSFQLSMLMSLANGLENRPHRIIFKYLTHRLSCPLDRVGSHDYELEPCEHLGVLDLDRVNGYAYFYIDGLSHNAITPRPAPDGGYEIDSETGLATLKS